MTVMKAKKREHRAFFPFTAIVNQERLKQALLLNAINPRIGGILIRGAKGTGKSTSVRALVDLLPEVEVVEDCPFNCNPRDPTNMCDLCQTQVKKDSLPVTSRKMAVVELPIGATEDRVVGTLNIEQAIREGVTALEPAAASGWNNIEREGISVQHPSRFILVGTMNPEEGELRPQLLDRLALHTEIYTIRDPMLRVEVMKLNLEFEEDAVSFRERFSDKQRELVKRILRAKELLPKVRIPDRLFEIVARMCIALNVDGHRPEIIIVKSALTLAAFRGMNEVELDDILDGALLTLGHRTRSLGMEPPASIELIEEEFKKALTFTHSH
jgi:Mg-chelatase subunit ChlI